MVSAPSLVGTGCGVDGGEQPPEAYERPEDMPERDLWAAALELLIKDGQAYWRNASRRREVAIEQEQAFDDLMRCGPMTRHVCRWLDADPVKVSEWFIQWCESKA